MKSWEAWMLTCWHVSSTENFPLTRTRMSMPGRTMELCCFLWDGDMFDESKNRVTSFMMRYGNLKMSFRRKSSSSIQTKHCLEGREQTNRRNEMLTHTIWTIHMTNVFIASFHLNSLFILVSRNFTLLLFSYFHPVHSPYINYLSCRLNNFYRRDVLEKHAIG
jgi:hypothetical protein